MGFAGGPLGFLETLMIVVLGLVKFLFHVAVLAAVWKVFLIDRKMTAIMPILEEIRRRPPAPQ